MIPLSNGRSPRIDQFYATLRTYKSHQLDGDHFSRPDEDRSIDHIRSLGKEIFEDEPQLRKTQKVKQQIKNMNRSAESLVKPSNLYDKYKDQLSKKVTREVNRAKQIVICEEINKSTEKFKVNKKYQQVPSKLDAKPSSKLLGLNYAKKADIEAQRLKKQREETQRAEKEIREKQALFESIKSTKSKQIPSPGVLKRTQELRARKQKCIEKIRNEQFDKQMSNVTFFPQMISRQIATVEPDFQKRAQLASAQKQWNEKQLIKEAVSCHSFNPQLNLYRDSHSKVGRIWKESKNAVRAVFQQNNRTAKSEELEENEYKSPQGTANSTLQINLQNLNQISFIFQ